MKRALAIAAILLLALPGLASAAPGADATGAAKPKRMKLGFFGRTAPVAGPGAMVTVKCTGSVAGSCTGTLSLAVAGESEEVPFSLAAGEKRILVVPLGACDDMVERPGSTSALAVAETVQPSGGVVASKHRLRLN